jgi:tetratricopeptide (TPR) repeat protein
VEWGHRRARQLLRRLRTPGTIRDDDEVIALQRATRTTSLRDAIRCIAERALGAYPGLYATIVRRVDVEGESCKIVMDELHLSERSFYRYRSAAIGAIETEITSALQTPLPGAPAHVDLDVLALYAKGRYLWRHRTRASLERALTYFERAFSRDQRFPQAHAGIADVHVLQGEYLIRDHRAAFADAHAALARAFAIDPELPEALAARADLYVFESGDHESARAMLGRALARDPQCTSAHHVSAWLALLEGDGPTTRSHVHAALATEPDALDLLTTLGIAECVDGEVERGLAQLGEVLDLDPSFSFARFELVRILSGLGRYEPALSHLAVLLASETRATYAIVLAYLEALAGRNGRALRALRLETPERESVAGSHYLLALLHLGLGDHGAALRQYRRAVAAREPLTALLLIDGFLRPLREHEGFAALLEEFRGRQGRGVAS